MDGTTGVSLGRGMWGADELHGTCGMGFLEVYALISPVRQIRRQGAQHVSAQTSWHSSEPLAG
jgi:hypothetical protein